MVANQKLETSISTILQVLLEKKEAILAKVTKEVSRPCDFDHLSNKEK